MNNENGLDNNTDTSTNGTEGADAPGGNTEGGSESEEMKRHRTSPRTKAFDETLAMIDTYIKGWSEEKNEDIRNALLASFSHLQGKVTELRDAGAPKPAYGGRHYVGVTADGARVWFQKNTAPTKRADGAKFASVLGPFRTKEGAGYVVEKGARPSDKIVF